MVQEAVLTPLEAVPTVEMHRRYIDVQSPITGSETFGLQTANAEQRALPFDGKAGCVLFRSAPNRSARIRAQGSPPRKTPFR